MSDLARKLNNQYRAALREDSPYVLFLPSEENTDLWFVLVLNLDYPYRGGEYIFRLKFKDTFPHHPPSLSCLTPNGVYQDNGGPICISIGEFHANGQGSYGWRPALGARGFVREVVNGLLCPDELGGIGLLGKSDKKVRQKYADASVNHNWEKCPEVMAAFERYHEDEFKVQVASLRLTKKETQQGKGPADVPDLKAVQRREAWRTCQRALALLGTASGSRADELATVLREALGDEWARPHVAAAARSPCTAEAFRHALLCRNESDGPLVRSLAWTTAACSGLPPADAAEALRGLGEALAAGLGPKAEYLADLGRAEPQAFLKENLHSLVGQTILESDLEAREQRLSQIRPHVQKCVKARPTGGEPPSAGGSATGAAPVAPTDELDEFQELFDELDT
jgi:ubiquitin-protein ligase